MIFMEFLMMFSDNVYDSLHKTLPSFMNVLVDERCQRKESYMCVGDINQLEVKYFETPKRKNKSVKLVL